MVILVLRFSSQLGLNLIVLGFQTSKLYNLSNENWNCGKYAIYREDDGVARQACKNGA